MNPIKKNSFLIAKTTKYTIFVVLFFTTNCIFAIDDYIIVTSFQDEDIDPHQVYFFSDDSLNTIKDIYINLNGINLLSCCEGGETMLFRMSWQHTKLDTGFVFDNLDQFDQMNYTVREQINKMSLVNSMSIIRNNIIINVYKVNVDICSCDVLGIDGRINQSHQNQIYLIKRINNSKKVNLKKKCNHFILDIINKIVE